MAYKGDKETLSQTTQMVKFFHLVVHSGLIYSINNFMLVRRFKYHLFAFLICNYCLKWGWKFNKIFGHLVLLKFDLEYHKHNSKVLTIQEHDYLCYPLENTLFPPNLNFCAFSIVMDTCLFQHYLRFKNIKRFSSFPFGIIAARWNYISKCKNIVFK